MRESEARIEHALRPLERTIKRRGVFYLTFEGETEVITARSVRGKVLTEEGRRLLRLQPPGRETDGIQEYTRRKERREREREREREGRGRERERERKLVLDRAGG